MSAWATRVCVDEDNGHDSVISHTGSHWKETSAFSLLTFYNTKP